MEYLVKSTCSLLDSNNSPVVAEVGQIISDETHGDSGLIALFVSNGSLEHVARADKEEVSEVETEEAKPKKSTKKSN